MALPILFPLIDPLFPSKEKLEKMQQDYYEKRMKDYHNDLMREQAEKALQEMSLNKNKEK